MHKTAAGTDKEQNYVTVTHVSACVEDAICKTMVDIVRLVARNAVVCALFCQFAGATAAAIKGGREYGAGANASSSWSLHPVVLAHESIYATEQQSKTSASSRSTRIVRR